MPRRKITESISDREEAEIHDQIKANPDDFEPSDAEIVSAKPFSAAFPDLAASIKRARGRPRVEKPKQLISLRLDPDVIEKFKRTGKGWQDRVNEILKLAKI